MGAYKNICLDVIGFQKARKKQREDEVEEEDQTGPMEEQQG